MDTSDNLTGPDVSANADVDSSGTLLLQQMLTTMYPNQIFAPRLEADLKRRAYDCGPDPADATRRACLSSVKDGPCEVHTIIPTKPYAPNKAQVIRICAATPS